VRGKLEVKLLKAMLPHVVMQMLKGQPMHGYQIMMEIRKRHGVSLGASTIYPLLSKMEQEGLIKSTWDLSSERPRKPYTLTSQGTATLQKQGIIIAAELGAITR